jgi:DNA-binding NtrC family response regulator
MVRLGNNRGQHYARTILALDDDFDIVTLIRSSLQRRGFDVFAFTDPHLALEHFELNATAYGLIISDVRMPGMNGFEFVRKVKEIKPDIRVFLMTAFQITDIEFSRLLPSTIAVDSIIQKPISIENLSILVQNHVKVTRKPNQQQ